jgi:hypothetical protein
MSIASSRKTSHTIHFEVCERCFSLDCADPRYRDLLNVVFGALSRPASAQATPVASLGRIFRDTGNSCLLESPGVPARAVASRADLIHEVDKNLTLALQRARPDLLFLHAAAVELDGRAVVMCGSSGTGKSTMTFALLHHGFGYLSDELAPIEVESGLVLPYAHALCLKSLPPSAPYRLPADMLDAGETLHVPVAALPGASRLLPRPLAALVFLRRDGSTLGTGLLPLTVAAASAHLLSSSLNALAHRDQGADAALVIARRVPAFQLDIGDLRAAVEAVRAILAR